MNTMKCNEIQARLSEYLDGALRAEEAVALEEHMAQCAACKRELEALRRTVQAVGELPRCAAPAGFRDKVVQRIRAESAVEARPRVVYFWPRLAAVAAMLLVVVGVTLLLERGALTARARPSTQGLAMDVAKTVGEGDLAKKAEMPVAERKMEQQPVAASRATEAAVAAPAQNLAEKRPAADAEARRPSEPVAHEYAGAKQAEGGRTGPAAAAPGAAPAGPSPVGGAAGAGDRMRAQKGHAALEEGKGEAALQTGATAGAKGARETAAAFREKERLERGVDKDQLADRKGQETILTVVAEQPLELARKTVEMARANGIRDATMPKVREDAGDFEIVLNVPKDAYAGFRQQVAQLCPAADQRWQYAEADALKPGKAKAATMGEGVGGAGGAPPAAEKRAVAAAEDTSARDEAEQPAERAAKADVAMKATEESLAKANARKDGAEPATVRLVIRFVRRAAPAEKTGENK
jgi:anti-sigma factor RsiW